MASPAHPSFISSLSRVRAARIVAAIGLLGAVATAQAVTIQIDSFTLTPGAGYGVDDGENGGTLLGVLFTSDFRGRQIVLHNTGDEVEFDVGFVNFGEPDTGSNGNRGIRGGETDALGVEARFGLAGPILAVQNLTASGQAVVGRVDDQGVDYMLTWAPVTVRFGVGGLFEIDLKDLSFSSAGTQSLSATVTLLDPPQPRSVAPVPGAVPEPGTLAIFALGLAGLGTLRRARRAG